MLNLVPLFTVAFVYVARYPLFQEWLDALERFLLRHLLPESESIVRTYLLQFAAKAAGLQGLSIAFVVATAVLLVATIEREINAIWGVREPRSWLRRAFVYSIGLTAGPLADRRGDLRDDVAPQGVGARGADRHAGDRLHRDAARDCADDARLHAALCAPARAPRAACGGASGADCSRRWGSRSRNTVSASTSRSVSTYGIIYGSLAIVPLFLLWIYVSWYVVLVGAAVTATLAEGGPRGRARPDRVEPATLRTRLADWPGPRYIAGSFIDRRVRAPCGPSFKRPAGRSGR